MPRGFGRLPFLGRRSTGAPSSSDDEAALLALIDPDLAPVGPPVLLPSAIYRQPLLDATELVPTWAMPRAESKATKRPRRSKSIETSAAKPATATPRSRTRKRDV